MPAFVPPLSMPQALRNVGSTIADKYVLLEAIGAGSMGSVYRARHTGLDREVALKLMAPEVAHDKAFTARFRREAHAASRLTHPNSVMITDFGQEPDGLLYLVMEYVRGPSLETMLERGDTFSERRIVDILSQVLSAVAVAHAAGIVHRDLKPANVLVVEATDDDGRPVDLVKVCDFGVAALRDRSELGITGRYAALRPSELRGRKLTMAGSVVGTPAYMAPEQASGGVQDARTDLYSLGVALFEMLTGRLPLWGDTLEDTMRAQIETPAPSPCDFVECTPALAAVCLRALAKRPGDRFESARTMRAALRAALAPEELAAIDIPLSAQHEVGSLAGVAAIQDASAPPRRRSAARWGWAAVALAAGALSSVTWLSRGRPYEAEALGFVRVAAQRVTGMPAPLAAESSPTPERAPLTVAIPLDDALVPPAAPSAVASSAHDPLRNARGHGYVRGDGHHREPSTETELPTGAPVTEAVVEPSARPAPPAPQASSGNAERAWETRH